MRIAPLFFLFLATSCSTFSEVQTEALATQFSNFRAFASDYLRLGEACVEECATIRDRLSEAASIGRSLQAEDMAEDEFGHYTAAVRRSYEGYTDERGVHPGFSTTSCDSDRVDAALCPYAHRMYDTEVANLAQIQENLDRQSPWSALGEGALGALGGVYDALFGWLIDLAGPSDPI